MIEKDYINHLETCFKRAEAKQSKLIQEIHEIPGMTGEMTRHFYNNLLSVNGIKYLEIGCWHGSSICSAMYRNNAQVVAIDNFSNFGSPREVCLQNFEKFKGINNATFIDDDCFGIDVSKFKNKFNVFLADGDHSYESQCRYLDYYITVMEDVFIFIADDWNWVQVREGTYDSILKNRLEIVWNKEIRLTYNNEHTSNGEGKDTWHNGIGVFLLKKFK